MREVSEPSCWCLLLFGGWWYVIVFWAVQEKVGATHCVDIATLTGAQIIALGGSIGAVMSPADSAAARVITAGTKTGGEKWWQLPLEDEYFELMKSKVCKMRMFCVSCSGISRALVNPDP